MNVNSHSHQYVDRTSGTVITEKLIGDKTISFLYNTVREQAPAMFKAVTGSRMSSILGYVHFDTPSPDIKRRPLLKNSVSTRQTVLRMKTFTLHTGRYLNARFATGVAGPCPKIKRALLPLQIHGFSLVP